MNKFDDRGESPWLLVAAVAVFLIVGAGLASGLGNGLLATSVTEVNVALDNALSTTAKQAAAQGYDALAALPAQATVTLRLGDKSVDVLRSVTLNSPTRTARVTFTTGKYGTRGFVPADACAPACAVATELVSGADQTHPTAG